MSKRTENPNRPALFLKKFVQQGVRIASVTPSSKWLAQAALRNIDWNSVGTIVELGAGTGAITNEILRHRPASCTVVVLERDKDFVEILTERFGTRENVHIVQSDLTNLEDDLASLRVTTVDHFVSGLPFPSLKKEMQQSIMRSVRELLHKNGSYNQITEMPYIYKFLYKRFFKDVTYKNEPRNIPPGGVYTCKHPIIITNEQ